MLNSSTQSNIMELALGITEECSSRDATITEAMNALSQTILGFMVEDIIRSGDNVCEATLGHQVQKFSALLVAQATYLVENKELLEELSKTTSHT